MNRSNSLRRGTRPFRLGPTTVRVGFVKVRLATVFDAQHGGFAMGWSPVNLGVNRRTLRQLDNALHATTPLRVDPFSGASCARQPPRLQSCARTLVTVSASGLPTDRRRLCAPHPPAWPIAPGSTRVRDAARESAHRSRLERWPRSMGRDGHLGGPSAYSTTAETPGQRRESREPEGGEMGLIRFRGHVPKGGYDVPNGSNHTSAVTPAIQ